MEHEIERPYQFAKMISNRRTHAAANAIAIYCSAQDLTHGKAYTRARFALVLTVERRHVPGKMFPALFVHNLKVSMLQ